MKRIIAFLLTFAMLISFAPMTWAQSFTLDASACFTWAWDASDFESIDSVTVVSWKGGTKSSFRSGFVIFDLPQNLNFNAITTTLTADFTINSATLNNGTWQAPTAAVALINPIALSQALQRGGSDAAMLLSEARRDAKLVGTYKIGSTTPTSTALKNIDLTDYITQNPEATKIAFYLTNLEADGYDCVGGIASAMKSFTLTLNTAEDGAGEYIYIKDAQGATVKTIVCRGESGATAAVSDFLPSRVYKDGKSYAVEQSDATLTFSANPSGIDVSCAMDELLTYPISRAGYSGAAIGDENTAFIATTGSFPNGSSTQAPIVSGVSNSGTSASMGSVRVGVMEFNIDAQTLLSELGDATLNFYVPSVHANLYSAWLRLGVYETSNPYIDTYSLSQMDDASYSALNDDYSADAVMWSNEKISSSSVGWKTVSIKRAVSNALAKNAELGHPFESVRVVLRLEVPVSGIYLTVSGENAPYITVSDSSDLIVADYDFSELTQSGRVRDLSDNGFDALLLGDAAIENGRLILNGNGGAKIDYTAFRAALSSYTINTKLSITDALVTNTRIYDFGAASSDSGFLRVKDFAVGMKYAGGTTVLASYSEDNDFRLDTPNRDYNITVTYDADFGETKVYIDGALVVATSAIKHSLNSFSDTDAVENYIGRTNWYSSLPTQNPDIKASYDSFTVYNAALDESAVMSLYNPSYMQGVDEAAQDMDEIIAQMAQTPTSQNLDLALSYTSGDGYRYSVSWHSTDTAVIDEKGTILRGASDTESDIYATISAGGYSADTAVHTFTVSALPEAELLAHTICKYDFSGAGSEIVDVSGNGRNAAATDNALLHYNRGNIAQDCVAKLPDNINRGISDYTIAAWVRADDLSRSGQRIYDFGVENGTSNGNYYAFLRLEQSGRLTVGVNNGGSTQTVESSGALAEGEWAHVAITYSSTSKNTSVYINGELDTQSSAITYTMGGAVYNGVSRSNYIGRSQWYLTQSASNPDFVGKIDNFALYDITLSASHIKAFMDEGFDTLDTEIISAAVIEGSDRAIVSISSKAAQENVTVIAAAYEGRSLTKIATEVTDLNAGANSVVVALPDMQGSLKAENTLCFVWNSLSMMQPLTALPESVKNYEFNYDYEYPDNHLLSNAFSLRLYDTQKYLALQNGVTLTDSAAQSGALWSAPYENANNAEGYYALKNTDGTYLSLDSGTLTTGKVNNWRLTRIDTTLTGGAKNVYAVRQRSSGKYLASDGTEAFAAENADAQSAWWVLNVEQYDAVSEAFMSPGCFILTQNQRARLYGATSQAIWLSSTRRNKLKEYMGDTYFSKTPSQQAEVLLKVLSYVPVNQVNRAVNASATGNSSAYDLSEITGSASYTGKDGENLSAYTATVTYYTDSDKATAEQTVRIYGRNTTVIANIAKGFSYIPYQFRRYIKTIKDYYHTANQFNCGASEMYVRTSYNISSDGFAMTASHELGHSLSFSWGYFYSGGEYTSAMANDIITVSGYGNSNNAEDLAEFTQLVVSCSGDKELLRIVSKMYPGRFAVLRSVMRSMNGGSCIIDF